MEDRHTQVQYASLDQITMACEGMYQIAEKVARSIQDRDPEKAVGAVLAIDSLPVDYDKKGLYLTAIHYLKLKQKSITSLRDVNENKPLHDIVDHLLSHCRSEAGLSEE